MPAIHRGYRTSLKTRDNSNMPPVLKGSVNQQEIAQAVQRAANALAPTVVRIRYDFGPDWTGDPSIFFRIILTDEAARKAKLSETAQTITLALLREVNAEEQGLHAYFNFRSLSEISKLNEPAWA
jgi:hypothetical protein